MEFELANKLRVAWHFNGSYYCSVLLHNDVGSVAAEPLNAVAKSEFFVGFIFVAVELDVIHRGSEIGSAASSAEA